MGWIASIDLEKDQVWVDFQANPAGKPLLAKLGRPFHLEDLKQALEQVQDIRLEFAGNSLHSPIIQDIYYSILKKPRQSQNEEDLAQQDIHLKGRRIILEGAEKVLSTATSRNRLRGGTISLN